MSYKLQFYLRHLVRIGFNYAIEANSERREYMEHIAVRRASRVGAS